MNSQQIQPYNYFLINSYRNVFFNSKKSSIAPLKMSSEAKTQSTPTTKQKRKSSATQINQTTNRTQKAQKKGTLEDEYKKLTKLEHCLKRPDMYIGDIKKRDVELWVYDQKEDCMKMETIKVSLGAMKVVDEVLINARDIAIKYPGEVTRIDVKYDTESGEIEVKDDGPGIPVEKHKKWDQYIMEGIFGDFQAGSNFGDGKKIWGGKNGIGSKATNAYSTMFYAETRDKVRQKKHTQSWTNNMSEVSKPKITNWKGKSGVTVRFILDWKRFNMTEMDPDFVRMLEKRVYDLSACTDESVKIYLNGKMIAQKSFDKYISLYVGGVRSGGKRVVKTFPNEITKEKLKENDLFKNITTQEFEMIQKLKWDVAVARSDEGYQHVSFVNGITTWKGGKHIDYISKQIVTKVGKKLRDILKKKKKDKINIKPEYIREHIFLFVNSTIVDPGFGSQTKEECTTDPTDFGFECTLDDDFIDDVIKKCSLEEAVLRYAEYKSIDLTKTDGKQVIKLTGIPNFEDAHNAGEKNKSQNCTLLITEGLSAKTFAVSGFGVVGRDDWGVWPIKGKIINPRDMKKSKLMTNAQYIQIKKILGLQENKKYTTAEDISTLRYGCIMFLTDQDPDGSHIKGLLINIFATCWPELLEVPGFFKCFKTPLVKLTRGNQSKLFFSLQDFDAWRQESGTSGWTAKYLKGLGSNDPREALLYFSERDKYITEYYTDNLEKTLTLFNQAFGKNEADTRKDWLGEQYDERDVLDWGAPRVSFDDFIQKELVHFFKYATSRAVPNICDGLKTGQRKVLFTCRKKNITKDTKVFELAGAVAKTSAYHHGDSSLNGTIIGMAQDYSGSNNLNLLVPCGEFGSRTLKGNDASAPRYIHTKIDEIVNRIFPKADDPLLKYRDDDDGNPVEPVCFVPIIPMVLINGSEGTGVGFSSTVPLYNPKEIIDNLKLKLEGKPINELKPWYRDFTGYIEKIDKDKYLSHGHYVQLDSTKIRVLELPIGNSKDTKSFKAYFDFLEESIIKSNEKDPKMKRKMFIKDFKNDYTRDKCDFTIKFPSADALSKLLADKDKFEKKLNLQVTINTSNMYLFDEEDKIEKYKTIEEIFEKFYKVRLDLYNKRREYYLDKMLHEISKFKEKIRFLELIMDGKLTVYRVHRNELVSTLQKLNFKVFDDDMQYGYLLQQTINKFTNDELDKIRKELAEKEKEYQELYQKTPTDIWSSELNELEQLLSSWEKRRIEERDVFSKLSNPKKKRKKNPKK